MNNSEYSKQYYQENKEAYKIRQRRYEARYPEKLKEKRKRDVKLAKEKRRLYRLNNPIVKIYKSWEKIRIKILQRDKFICQNCEAQATEVHHRDGTGSNRLAKEVNNNPENLISVCHRCNIRLDLELRGVSVFAKDFERKPQRDKKIMDLLKVKSQSEISRELGITRQRVSQIVKRFDKVA